MTAATLLLVAFLAAPVPATTDAYVGVWTLAGTDDMRAAVDKVVSKMNFLIRGIARGRLEKTQIAFPSIEISRRETEFRIRHLEGTDVAHRDTDTPIRTKSPDGSDIEVRLIPGPPLVQTYESADGRRENRYELSESGERMTVSVRVTSPRLPEAVAYKMYYRRSR